MKRSALFGIMVATLLSLDGAKAAQTQLARKVQRIERACHLHKGSITAVADEVHFGPSPTEKLENVDCALARLKRDNIQKLGFIGNAYDPKAVLEEPYEYIVEGSSSQIATLSSALRSEGWIIEKLARADDGTLFLVFKTRQGETSGGAGHLMQRIWKKEFGDILLSRAPQPLAAADTAVN